MSEDRMAVLEKLVRAHQARLRAYLFSRTGQTDVADDLAQEVYLVAFRLIDQYDPSRPAWPWLVGIARNELREHWRATARDRRPDDLESLLSDRLISRDEGAAGDPPDRSTIDALERCLEKLPDHSREIVRMVYQQRMNCAEAARRLSQKAGAIRTTLHRIRRALHACVQATLAGRPA